MKEKNIKYLAIISACAILLALLLATIFENFFDKYLSDYILIITFLGIVYYSLETYSTRILHEKVLHINNKQHETIARPYLHVVTVPEKENTIFQIVNSGKTPAYQSYINIEFFYSNHSRRKLQKNGPLQIAPQGFKRYQVSPDLLKEPNLEFAILNIEYDDVFNYHATDQIKFRVKVDNDHIGLFIVDMNGERIKKSYEIGDESYYE